MKYINCNHSRLMELLAMEKELIAAREVVIYEHSLYNEEPT